MDSRSSPLLVTLGLEVSTPRSKIEKSITRSTLVSQVRQTCTTVADRVCCEKHSAAWSVTAGVVNYLCFAVIGDRRSACGDIRQSGQLAYLFLLLVEK